MTDKYPPTVQRPALLKLVEALGVRDNTLRRDECGDWQITGGQGHIYVVPGSLDRPTTAGFQIVVLGCETVRQWTAAKSAMKPFTDITNDGDSEGAFFLDHLPTRSQAGIIRNYVGVRKRREDSEEALAGVRSRTSKYRFQAKRPASDKHRIL